MHVTLNGVPGDFLLDTGGGNTLVTEDFSSRFTCTFWGRTTGYNMFGKRGDGPHCDGIPLAADEVPLTPVDIGKIDFAGQFPEDKAPDGLLSLDAFDGKQRLRVEIAPGIRVDSPVIVTDMIMDGNLGQPFMSQYVLTFDLRNGRLWIGNRPAT